MGGQGLLAGQGHLEADHDGTRGPGPAEMVLSRSGRRFPATRPTMLPARTVEALTNVPSRVVPFLVDFGNPAERGRDLFIGWRRSLSKEFIPRDGGRFVSGDGYRALMNLFRPCSVSLRCTGGNSRFKALRLLPTAAASLRRQDGPEKSQIAP
jgi:hypothetical protein